MSILSTYRGEGVPSSIHQAFQTLSDALDPFLFYRDKPAPDRFFKMAHEPLEAACQFFAQDRPESGKTGDGLRYNHSADYLKEQVHLIQPKIGTLFGLESERSLEKQSFRFIAQNGHTSAEGVPSTSSRTMHLDEAGQILGIDLYMSLVGEPLDFVWKELGFAQANANDISLIFLGLARTLFPNLEASLVGKRNGTAVILKDSHKEEVGRIDMDFTQEKGIRNFNVNLRGVDFEILDQEGYLLKQIHSAFLLFKES